MGKDTKIISIAGQKGGTGKSTTLITLLNYIHKFSNISFLAVDCDDLQQTLNDVNSEKVNLSDSLQQAPYDVVTIMSKDFPSEVTGYVESEEYDYIFVDLPGNLKQPGVINSYMMVDYLFIPTSTSMVDIKSTIKYLEIYNREVIPVRKKFGSETHIFMFFAKVNERTIAFKEARAMQERGEFPIRVMDNYIKQLQHYQDEIDQFKVFEDSKPFCKEFIELIS